MLTEYTPELIERFYSKVSKTPTETGCLEWMAFYNVDGYGSFGVGGKSKRAHRVAWEIVNGPIPAGLVIRHMCNNRLCCNPAHLETGSYADNVRDMMSSGRWMNAPNTTAPYVRPAGPTAAERFYAKVSKTPNETGCLDWLAGRNKAGYGRLGIGGTHVLAHRFAWELVNGPIPAGMFACHICDRHICCNPAHIFIGTPADNTRDMIAKGRDKRASCPGERNGCSKLTEEQVLEIRSEKYSDWILADIAAQFGVSLSLISLVLKRAIWRHLDGIEDAAVQNRTAKGERQGAAKLTEAQVREIRSAKYIGSKQSDIAKRFGVGKSHVGRILRRECWTHI